MDDDFNEKLVLLEALKDTSRTSKIRQKRTSLELRQGREYLLQEEIDKILNAAKQSRKGIRDYTLILLMYYHGLRISEACRLRWSNINFDHATIWVHRSKGSISGTHPLSGSELRSLRKLKSLCGNSPYLFLLKEGVPISEHGIRKLIERLGVKAGLEIPIHPHMMRHSCGYKLINEGRDLRLVQSWLGHANISNTVRYTALAPNQFKDFWE